jgi:F0F1-type ATP synthase alpha subunit
MLIFGQKGTGKTTIGKDIILAQSKFTASSVESTDALRDEAVHCILCATHVDEPKVEELVRGVLHKTGARTTIVTSSLADGDEGALFGALTACVLGEHHRDNGRHSVVVLDELSGLQRLWDKGWKMVHEYLGRSEVPAVDIGQLRNWYMPLLQRAAKLDLEKRGGGSMSMVAMIDTPANPVDYPELAVSSSVDMLNINKSQRLSQLDIQKLDLLPNDLARLKILMDRGVELNISMIQQLGIRSQKLSGQKEIAATAAAEHPYYSEFQASKVHVEEMSSIADGHICLSMALKKKNIFPCLDPQLSLTRIGIGSRKEIRDHRSTAMQKVATRLRIDLTAALDAVKLNCSAEEVAHAKKQLAAWRAALSQSPHQPLSIDEQVALLFVAAAYYDNVIVAEALKGGNESLILRHMRSVSSQLLEEIRVSGDVSETSAKLLDVSVRLFTATASTL